ncbi:LysR family transcriptional regulator [Paenibacillus sp. BIHB 4019]|uniref:LysR family transcriptional regulator n=1 Tax=Paenibacillus sp. BIHB 4019 TaxID=1870819 RepID=A0A1B2DLC0_9BACL|nr:LysR family transcriptional regulator [Paenibacillus sp. BIHB 4019]ANY68518.1 LysR family transcriptional regulator [Paenibacillus sp. BIHB 4019]
MTNSQLTIFIKIAETGSFTKAGLELNMTQPAVSRAISTLETELGVVLLIRDRRNGVLLTDIGRRLLTMFREILKSYERIEQEISREKGLEIGTIRVGAFPVASAYFLPKIMRAIAYKYPHLEFELHEGTIDEVKEWLHTRIIDVALIIPPDEAFETIPLYKERMYAVMRDDHPLAGNEVISVKDISGNPLINCKSGYETPIVELFQRAETELEIKFIIKNVNTLLSMVQEGLGMSILSELAMQSLPPNVIKLELSPEGYREIRLAVPSLEEASLAVKLFIETALELFAPAARRV